ncbi:hypothetical protein AVEN_210565-1 [Araneus ventricosus]|uniref:Uncharacterized protein n=1 Tax=Araneus ventricosus TaxID=182803 RepID=A0A4Y2TEC5_ARAVE|nr:hypothetical protein AVEN_210565-1 [Araneus ventricosus]
MFSQPAKKCVKQEVPGYRLEVLYLGPNASHSSMKRKYPQERLEFGVEHSWSSRHLQRLSANLHPLQMDEVEGRGDLRQATEN